jgi:hypothetical protein
MIYRVTATLEICGTSGGIRQRTVTLPDGETRTLTFSKEPVYLDMLPPEIAEDPHLIVREVPEGSALDGPVVSLKSERVEEPEAVAAKSDGSDRSDEADGKVIKGKPGRKPRAARAKV